MKKDAYLGLDLGGGGVKVGLVDREGNLVAFAHQGLKPRVTSEGFVEFSFPEVYDTARTLAARAIAECHARVLALSVSSQGQTFVSLDEDDEPLHPAMAWYDSRAAAQAKKLQETVSANLRGEAMPDLPPISSAPKILWLREHYPEVMRRARRFLLLPEYFSYRLTGQAVTDPTIAYSSGFCAEDAPGYCQAVLAAAGVSEQQLARIQPPGTRVGHVRKETAPLWGLSQDTLVVTGTNDQFAGALGAGNCRPGIVSETTGTCLALVALRESLPKPMPPGLLGARFVIPRYCYALAYAKTAGVVLEWFQRELGCGEPLPKLDELAAQVPIGSRGLTVLPHFEGMVSPTPIPEAHGSFLNLGLHHTRADLYRAILESLSFSLHENILLLKQSGFVIDLVRSIGGGARSAVWLQMKADVTGLAVERPKITEAAVFGAAMLAAVGQGAFSSIKECSHTFYKTDRVFEPNPSNHTLYRGPFERYRKSWHHIYQSSGLPAALA